MVKYELVFKAQLENIAEIETGEGDSFGVSLQMLCNYCGCLVNKEIKSIPRSSWPNIHHPPSNSLQCNSCDRLDKIKLTRTQTKLTSEHNGEGEGATIAQMECKEYTPSACILGQGWKAISCAGTVYENVDLSMDFYNFDPNGNFLVSITNPKLTFQEVKEEGTSRRNRTRKHQA